MADLPHLQVMSPNEVDPRSAPNSFKPGQSGPMEIDPSQRPSILTPLSQGTGLTGPMPATSSNMPSAMESVTEFVTPTKAQMRQAMNQMQLDMQHNVQAANDFVQKHELQSDRKCEAILKEQQQRFEHTAREWESTSQD